ncbi:YlxR family protein [Halalkalibacterium halodurans]|jgi:predicted RNA-binding protein YlxR (DUF448 family)|uniref:BH2415 protein n=2 Tax=Halalkalibacterium halodurans TaxID=86665 RepID=Q9KA75_HALH5|nr:YlxR family protein [Halalkalibacterium halodurans]MDY7222963.1 YlxR family protein [Halalkalibacterium halodurans]MDY7242184.1 YlxR family protein [Halalkalibacterium halodurans]MED3646208.1 YlxR family protein [Halalkalibacterium halodurans]MED4080080.1 YlxR family protein [Halalkalibacterium halodurans]MED4086847.1 YlxR family protein [Halalkalibacterium halodurans]
MKQRKIPLRKCVVTNEMKPKQELIRVVRSPEGNVFIDPTGKQNGRGAYISNNKECFELAKKKDILSKHLNVKVSDDVYDQLEEARQRGSSK